jgi:hypothetical protein
MRGYLALVLFTALLVAAMPHGPAPHAQVAAGTATPQPAQFLPFTAKEARLGQVAAGARVGLTAAVYVNPRWAVMQATQPIQYLVLLDVTGSMSWDFNGYGTYDGSNTSPVYTVPNTVRGDVQCDSPDNPNPLNLPYTDRCIGGVNSAWKNQAERRVYTAKQALVRMVNQLGADDSMRIVGFSTAVTGTAQASGAWTSDKNTLITSLLNFGAYNNDPYKTTGGASNAIAMQRARELLTAAPATAPNGQPYRQVIVMLTDSVANVFLDGTLNTARDICANLTFVEALRTADPCQIGATANGKLRPISAMVDIANSIKSDHPNIEIHVVGLAQVAATGLVNVASDPSFYYTASQPPLLGPVLDQIQARYNSAACTVAGGVQWIDTVDATHLPDPVAFPGLSNTVVGFTYIYNINSATPSFTLPIQRDQATNRISFLLPPPDTAQPDAGIAPGNYEMEAYAAYKGDDQVSRAYGYFVNQSSLTQRKRIAFAVTPSGSLGSPGQVIPLDPLFLDLSSSMNICQ